MKKIKKLIIAEFGRVCFKCKNEKWLDHPIPLELHHIDGNHSNSKKENLELLCPNCHALTPNYRGKNTKKYNSLVSDELIITTIPKCQSILEVLKAVNLSSGKANYERVRLLINTNGCNLKSRERTISEVERYFSLRKVSRPSRFELEKLVWTHPTTYIANLFNVSDKAISKWCEFYGITKPCRGYWTKIKYGATKGT